MRRAIAVLLLLMPMAAAVQAASVVDCSDGPVTAVLSACPSGSDVGYSTWGLWASALTPYCGATGWPNSTPCGGCSYSEGGNSINHYYCDATPDDNGDPEECQPDPEFPPVLNMHWDAAVCQWVFDDCQGGADGLSTDVPYQPGLEPGTAHCVSGCIFTSQSVSGGVAWLTETDSSCEPAAGSGLGGAPDHAGCVSNDAGEWCYQEPPEGPNSNCGWFNGEYVCPDGIPDNTCVSTQAGSIVCVGAPFSGPPDQVTPDQSGQPPWNTHTNENDDVSATSGDAFSSVSGGGAGGMRPPTLSASQQYGAAGAVATTGGASQYVRVDDVPDLYTPTDKTYSGVMEQFAARMEALPVASTISGFFDVSINGGACPIWQTTIPVFGTIRIDQQCSAIMQSIWPWIAAIIAATAAFLGYRIAFG